MDSLLLIHSLSLFCFLSPFFRSHPVCVVFVYIYLNKNSVWCSKPYVPICYSQKTFQNTYLSSNTNAGDIAFRFINYVRSVRERQLQRKLRHHQNLSWQEIAESYQEDKSKSLGDSQVVVCDINKEMLKVGKQRAQHLGYTEGKSCIVPFAW